jgi:hypothetical protein
MVLVLVLLFIMQELEPRKGLKNRRLALLFQRVPLRKEDVQAALPLRLLVGGATSLIATPHN